MEDAFVDRHARAEREHHHRDDETPEIQLAAIAERVGRVGHPAGRLAPPQKEQLIDAVDEAVNALGQHRRRAGERRRDELQHGNAEVRS
jgi:hypothetical protein